MTHRFDRFSLPARGTPVRPRFVFLFILFFLFFVFRGFSPAWAATNYSYNIMANGDIEIKPKGIDIGVSLNGVLQNETILTGDTITIYGSMTSTTNTITVSGGIKPKIILDGVNISVGTLDNRCAFMITGDADVDLTLSGDNILRSGGLRAGLQVEGTNTLTVGGSGKLTATGGFSGAGIGSGAGGNSGTITITGGTVTATGGFSGAGIGGGYGGNGGNINVTGGTVNTTGGSGGAGIGGGYGGDGGTITISGGTVIAAGAISAVASDGAGIGGGYGGDGGNINVTGGRVTATGGSGGAGIGGGYGGGRYVGGGNITITGGTVIAAGDNGADIGPGYGGSDLGSITITGGSVRPTTIPLINVSPQAENASGTSVYLNTLTVGDPAVSADTRITARSVDNGSVSYGINDVYTDTDGKVYFWLPGKPDGYVEVNAGGNSYGKTFTRSADHTIATLLMIPNPNPGPNPVPVTGVTLTSGDLTLAIGQKRQLQAVVSPDNAANKNLVWSSSDPEIVSVDKNGVVLGISPGTAVITAETEDGGFKARCTITVTKTGEVTVAIDLSGLNLEGGTLRLTRGQSADVTITATPSGASFAATGLPPGLTLSAGGRLTGAPDTLGFWAVTVTATLPDGTKGTAAFGILVRETEDSGGSSGSCTTGVLGGFGFLGGFAVLAAAFGLTRRDGKRGKNAA